MTRWIQFLVATLAVFLLTTPAQATCLMTCQATLVDEGCTPIPATAWPPWLKLQATVSCESCCSAPGGPLSCSDEATDMGSLSITQDGVDVGGSFMAVPDMCPDEDVYQYTPHLQPGDYALLSTQSGFNEILAQFTVHKPPCGTDDDCAPCEACEGDGCTWTGVPSCTTDDDCPEGKQCYVNVDDACLNGCGDPPEPPCETDADCG
ncbi:MAG: hypothetical protein QF464_22280, partial [Myxococcota bacterium]|nr:hypothetical protein [Myxococcota bacterium]